MRPADKHETFLPDVLVLQKTTVNGMPAAASEVRSSIRSCIHSFIHFISPTYRYRHPGWCGNVVVTAAVVNERAPPVITLLFRHHLSQVFQEGTR